MPSYYLTVNDAVRAKIDELVESKGLDAKDYPYSSDAAISLNQLSAILGGSGNSQSIADSIGEVLKNVSGNDDYYKLLARTIEDVVIPDGITNIPLLKFSSCSKVKSISIPDSVTIIEGGAFSGASRENGGVMFPLVANSVEEVRTLTIDAMVSGAFSGVDKINKLILPAIKTIADSAFSGCMGLEYIYLGPNCTSIGSSAFGGVSINCKVECGFAEGAISGFPNNAGFAGNPASLDITYNVPAPTIEY